MRRRSAIDKFELDGALRRIHATVYVDKPGQRAILLGEGGAQMKAIATQARVGHGEALRRPGVPRSVGAREERLGRHRRVACAVRLLSGARQWPRASPRERRDDEAAFVLHTYAYRETSLIVEAFTADHGRVAMVARGAKRPRSETRGLLQAFQPLTLSWAGAGELKTLLKAEWGGGLPLPARRGAAVRLLPERTAAEAAGARGPASGAVPRLRRRAGGAWRAPPRRGPGRRCCGASNCACWRSWATRCR